VNDRNEILDVDTWRPVISASSHVVTLANKWPSFGPGSRADLVITRRHATSLEELSSSELEEFFAQLLIARTEHRHAHAHSYVGANVGRDAGSSQPHFHGQVVSAGLAAPAAHVLRLTPDALLADEALAARHGLVVSESENHCAYATWAPSATGEIRVRAKNASALALSIQEVLRGVTRAFGERSYNIAIHGENPFVAQVLPKFTVASPMPAYFGLTIVTINPNRVADALRAAM
jgi:galactose-1-phosphate uridylyltransferase